MLVRATIEGIRPLIMHNGQGVDPLNPHAIALKKLTSLRTKTEVTLRDIAEVEFQSCLYWDDDIGVHIPSPNIQSMLHKGATKFKLGQKIIGAIVEEEIGAPLQTPNATNFKKLTENKDGKNSLYFRTSVVQNMSRIMKTRPRFPAGWKVAFHINIDTEIIKEGEVRDVLEMCGKMVGLGDWRPGAPKKPGTYGRFQVIGWEVVG